VAGYSAVVTPSTFTIQPGAKQTFTVKLTRTTAPLDTWAYGTLNWTDGTHTVRSPLTARGGALAAPASVYSEATSGSKVLTIGTGFAGAVSSVKGGLKPATRSDLSVAIATVPVDTAAQIRSACLAGDPGVRRVDVVVPANTLVARFATFDEETTGQGGNDIDILILNGANTAVAGSLTGGSNEMVTMQNPAPGTYKACLVGYGTENNISQVDFTFSSWVVSTADVGGNFKVLMPAKAYMGGTASVGMSWSGLAAGKRHMGAFTYATGGVTQGMTLVEVNTNDPVPTAQNSRANARLAQ
jgi:Fibronectin type-III domain